MSAADGAAGVPLVTLPRSRAAAADCRADSQGGSAVGYCTCAAIEPPIGLQWLHRQPANNRRADS